MKIREWLHRLSPRRTDVDLESEMRFHLQTEEDAARRRGLSNGEAWRQAVLRAGSISSAMENARDQRTFPWISGSLSDLRHASFGLLRRPGFAVIAVMVLTVAVA